jgi:nucleoside 2-deoxyribosyltransferase
MGHIVTSRWIEEEIPETDFNTARSHRAGIKDFQDIDMAWVVLLFTNPPSTTGGMHVEMGYAMARRRTVIVIGPYTNIFQRQARCQFDNWNEFKKRYPL